MRTVLLSWAVGLVGLVSMSGCGLVQEYRERQAELVAAQTPSAPVTASNALNGLGAWDKDAPWPKAPPIVAAVEPEAVLPPPRIEVPEVTLMPEIAKNIDLPPPTEASPPAVKEVVVEKPPVKEVVVEKTAIKGRVAEKPAVKEAVVEKIEVRNPNAHVRDVDKFTSVVGKVQQFRKTWRLRYAPLEQDDLYGGSVVLEGADLDRLRDGQQIRVQGVLIAPTDRTSPARYRVKSLEILE